MPTEEYLVYSVPISFDLALNAFGKAFTPSATLLAKELLKLNRRCTTRIFDEL